MQTKFKRHQSVTILRAPHPDTIEWYGVEQLVAKGMRGKINILLPNGTYHVELLDEKGKTLAYAPFSEDDLEATS